jgi:hypothetical protein
MPIGYDAAELMEENAALKGENASLKKDMALFSGVVRQLKQYKAVAEGHWAAIGELRVAKESLAAAEKEADGLRKQLAEATEFLEAKGFRHVKAAPMIIKNRGARPQEALFMIRIVEEERQRALRCCWAASYLCAGTAREAASLIASGGGYAPENLMGADGIADKSLTDFLADVKASKGL